MSSHTAKNESLQMSMWLKVLTYFLNFKEIQSHILIDDIVVPYVMILLIAAHNNFKVSVGSNCADYTNTRAAPAR